MCLHMLRHVLLAARRVPRDAPEEKLAIVLAPLVAWHAAPFVLQKDVDCRIRRCDHVAPRLLRLHVREAIAVTCFHGAAGAIAKGFRPRVINGKPAEVAATALLAVELGPVCSASAHENGADARFGAEGMAQDALAVCFDGKGIAIIRNESGLKRKPLEGRGFFRAAIIRHLVRVYIPVPVRGSTLGRHDTVVLYEPDGARGDQTAIFVRVGLGFKAFRLRFLRVRQGQREGEKGCGFHLAFGIS